MHLRTFQYEVIYDDTGEGRVLVGPHAFASFRWKDRWSPSGRCRACYLPRVAHPVGVRVQARPSDDPVGAG